MTLRRSPLDAEHRELGATMVELQQGTKNFNAPFKFWE